jgi:hypothetical protein
MDIEANSKSNFWNLKGSLTCNKNNVTNPIGLFVLDLDVNCIHHATNHF